MGQAAGRKMGRREGALGLLLRQLDRLGPLPDELAGRVRALPASALRELALAQFAFKSLAGLERWLADHAGR
jgi:hypothetical protein